MIYRVVQCTVYNEQCAVQSTGAVFRVVQCALWYSIQGGKVYTRWYSIQGGTMTHGIVDWCVMQGASVILMQCVCSALCKVPRSTVEWCVKQVCHAAL